MSEIDLTLPTGTVFPAPPKLRYPEEIYADRIEALTAEVDRLREALREMFEVVCGETGFAQAVRAESGFAYPWPALDRAETMARAALETINENR